MRTWYKFRLMERWIDFCYDHDLPDWAYGFVPDWPVDVACWVTRKHWVLDDQCMNPAHRYCNWCGRIQPNAQLTKENGDALVT